MRKLWLCIGIIVTIFFIIQELKILYGRRRGSNVPEYIIKFRDLHHGKRWRIRNKETTEQISISLEKKGNKYDVKSFARKRGYKNFREFLCTEDPRIWQLIKEITIKKGFMPSRIIRTAHFYPSRNLKYCVLTEAYHYYHYWSTGFTAGTFACKIELINDKGEILWSKKSSVAAGNKYELGKFHPLVQKMVTEGEFSNWDDDNYGIGGYSLFYSLRYAWVSEDGERIITLQTELPHEARIKGKTKLVAYNKKGEILFQLKNVKSYRVNIRIDLFMVAFYHETSKVRYSEIALYNIKGEKLFSYKPAPDEYMSFIYFDENDILWGRWSKEDRKFKTIDEGLFKLDPKEKRLKRTKDEAILKKIDPDILKRLKRLKQKRKESK